MMKKILTGFIGLSMCMLLIACGEAEAPQMLEVNPIPLEVQQVSVNKGEEVQSEESSSNDKEPDNTVLPETKENTDDVQDSPSEKVEEGTQDNTDSPEPEQSLPTVTLSGTIKSVGNGSFTISRANVNGNVMVSTNETVNIIYTDNTEFVVCTSSDGGITANYADGTSADLCSGKIADIEGAYEGSDFVAQKVKVSIFI